MPIATLSTKGWIVIPADYRRRYHLEPGDKVQIIDYGGGLSIVPNLENTVKNAKGLLKGSPSLLESLLKLAVTVSRFFRSLMINLRLFFIQTEWNLKLE